MFDQARHRATLRLVRWLRHQLATPLSGAALHLELASQRLAKGEGRDPERALENVRMGQAEVEGASELLEILTAVVTSGEETPGPFSLPDAVVDGAALSSTNSRGVAVELPDRSPTPTLFGARRAVEQAVAELTGRAVNDASDREIVRWAVEETRAEERVVLSWPSRAEGNAAESFVGGGIVRWAVESHGGTVSARHEAGRVLVAAVFPRESV